jgi:toxin CcdB
MAQFDVYKNPRGGAFPLLVDVQADLLERLATRVVVPLMPAKKFGKPITRLNPLSTIAGVSYVLVFQELAGVPIGALGPRVASLADRRADLIAALDLLFTGI